MPEKWRIWIYRDSDFIDCLAVNEMGKINRVKVDNKGNLHGTILGSEEDGWILIQQNWNIMSDLFCGYNFWLNGSVSQKFMILAFDPLRSALKINGVFKDDTDTKEFEVGTDEEALKLVVRLVTIKSLNEKLPFFEIHTITKLPGLHKSQDGISSLLITDKASGVNKTKNKFQQKPGFFEQSFLNPYIFDSIVEESEVSYEKENDIQPLNESKINHIMRRVFHIKPGIVFIDLTKPESEKILTNLLKTAGYKYVITSYEYKQNELK